MTTTESGSDRKTVEACVLGSMALFGSSEAAEYAAAHLTGREFSEPSYRMIFRAICAMTQRGVPLDAVTIADELISRGDFETAGGATGLAEVLDSVPHAAHVRFYVQQLVKYHCRDCVQKLATNLQRSSEDPTIEISELIQEAIAELEKVQAGNVTHSELMTAQQALDQFDRQNTHEDGAVISTGLPDMDRQLLGGIRPGQLVVIGGRPGLGKTALLHQVILDAGKAHRPAFFGSLEMTPGELAGRALKTINRSRFTELPVLFAEASDFGKLASLLRLAKRRRGIQLAAIDYLQLMDGSTGDDIRERQVAAMSRGLKRLAMELQIPILLGSQLNRESEKQGRPSLANLRESGAIEQDADIVILLAGDADSDERELIVAKHRGGPCGMVRATFDRPRFWFSDVSPEPWTGNL